MEILSLKLVIFAHTSSPLAFVVLDSQTYFSSFVARCCSLEAKSIQKMMAKFQRLTPFILVDGKKQVWTSSKNLRKIVSDRPAAHEVLDVESDSRGTLSDMGMIQMLHHLVKSSTVIRSSLIVPSSAALSQLGVKFALRFCKSI